MAKKKDLEEPAKQAETVASSEDRVVPRAKPLVFVSHDSRDADLAEAFGILLSDSSGGMLKSFRSSDRKGTSGIEFGEEWYNAIMTKLGDATDVVALLTQHSLDRPWILYEAGVAKGKLDTKVLGIAMGIPFERVTTGPFAQFQNCTDDEDSLTKLVLQLMRRIPDADPREEAIRRQVQAFRQKVNALMKERKMPSASAQARVDENAVAKLFEEVKVMFRDLPDKVEGRLQDTFRGRGVRRMRRFHPGMIEDLLFSPMARELPDGQASGWLMFIGLFREEIPWLYEPGMELYHAMRSGDPERIGAARRRMIDLVHTLHRGPFLELLGPDKDMFIALEMLEHFLGRLEPVKVTKDRKSKSTEPSP